MISLLRLHPPCGTYFYLLEETGTVKSYETCKYFFFLGGGGRRHYNGRLWEKELHNSALKGNNWSSNFMLS